ncbi:hypothetical protein GCM10029992_23160 [Glycomyces albus]
MPHRRALLAAAPLLALAACSGSGEDANRVNELNRSRYTSGDGTNLRWDDPAERPEAPDLAGVGLDGEAIDTAEWAGDVIVVNFWGSWCPPCVSEAPELRAAAEHYEEQNAASESDIDVHLLGINSRDEKDAARAFEDRHQVPYPSIFDPPGQIAMQFIEYDVSPNTFPVTIVIDPEGRVFSIWRGEIDAETIYADVNQLLES